MKNIIQDLEKLGILTREEIAMKIQIGKRCPSRNLCAGKAFQCELDAAHGGDHLHGGELRDLVRWLDETHPICGLAVSDGIMRSCFLRPDHDGGCQNVQALQKTWRPSMFNQSNPTKPAPKPRCMNEKTFASKTGRMVTQKCSLTPGHAGVHCGGFVWENEDAAPSILPPEYTTKPVSTMKKLTTHLLADRSALEVQNNALKTIFEAAQFFGGVNPSDFDAATQREWKRHVQVLLGIACPAEASAEKKILEEKLILAGKGTFGRGSW